MYSKVDWKDKPDLTTPISATNLNIMDEGIYQVSRVVGDTPLETTATTATAAINENKSRVDVNENDINTLKSTTSSLGSSLNTTNNKLANKPGFMNTSKRVAISFSNGAYTATTDMWVIGYGYKSNASGFGAFVYLNGEVIASNTMEAPMPLMFPVKKGQTISINNYVSASFFGFEFI